MIYLSTSINEASKILKNSELWLLTVSRMKFVYFILVAMLPLMVLTLFFWQDYVMSIAITLLSMLGFIDIILTIERIEYSETKILVPLYIVYIILAVVTFGAWLL
ncbi:hypothetical protein [Clostridium cellulovorans]|nr:hypothetical protein [Clostridium cellulovorans]